MFSPLNVISFHKPPRIPINYKYYNQLNLKLDELLKAVDAGGKGLNIRGGRSSELGKLLEIGRLGDLLVGSKSISLSLGLSGLGLEHDQRSLLRLGLGISLSLGLSLGLSLDFSLSLSLSLGLYLSLGLNLSLGIDLNKNNGDLLLRVLLDGLLGKADVLHSFVAVHAAELAELSLVADTALAASLALVA